MAASRVRISDPPGKNWEGRGGAEIGEELIVAKDLLKEVMRHKMEVISEFPGSELMLIQGI